MEILLQRLYGGVDDTIGTLFINGDFECFTLEDEARETKLRGETRIPSGRYQIKFRNVLSGKTKRYRSKFDWFTWHLELQGVPGFKYIYIHIGNDDDDTDGCILVGYSVDFNRHESQYLGRSTQAFETFYKKVAVALEEGVEVYITVSDE